MCRCTWAKRCMLLEIYLDWIGLEEISLKASCWHESLVQRPFIDTTETLPSTLHPPLPNAKKSEPSSLAELMSWKWKQKIIQVVYRCLWCCTVESLEISALPWPQKSFNRPLCFTTTRLLKTPETCILMFFPKLPKWLTGPVQRLVRHSAPTVARWVLQHIFYPLRIHSMGCEDRLVGVFVQSM